MGKNRDDNILKLPFTEQYDYNEAVISDNNNSDHSYDDCCLDTCKTVDEFMCLTDELIETIIDLEEELVRWRQALIKYLPVEWAEGLRMDIFNNLSRDFEGDPAYDLYVKLKRGADPQHDEERIARLLRLADGTDDTSITYL